MSHNKPAHNPEAVPAAPPDQTDTPDYARDDQSDALYIRSGQEFTDDPLVSFLYDLLRDYEPAGVVERLVQNAAVPTTMTNGHIARYAKDVAARLRPGGS